jgi:hypothetical protein
MRGSLLHDALFQLIRLELLPLSYKQEADEILHDVCIEDGMNKLRANIWYDMVELFGGAACVPGSEPEAKIYEVGV